MAALTKQILDFTSNGLDGITEADRVALLQASTKLAETIENPMEMMLRMFFSLYDPMALRLAIDLDLIDIALAHNGPVTLGDFAQKSKADPNLLQRILRMLVALNVFTSPKANTYMTTPLSPVFATGSPARGAVIHITHFYHTAVSTPEYFATNGYQDPVDALDAPFNFAHDCKGITYFEYMARAGNERLSHAFNQTMEMKKGTEENEFAVAYPSAERLKNDDPERVLFVDVGGSMGHQVRRFAETYPELKGKLVLEDLPPVVEAAKDVPESIAKVGHDFFTPQPESVRGAKAYYLKMILHDWPKKQAMQILENIRDVMADDSVVLVHEAILPNMEVGHMEAKLDWHMMNLGALERNEQQWGELAESVGLKINGIWLEEEGFGRRGVIEMGKKL